MTTDAGARCRSRCSPALSWLLSLLLVARTATNLLALAPRTVPAARADHGRLVRPAVLRRLPVRARSLLQSARLRRPERTSPTGWRSPHPGSSGGRSVTPPTRPRMAVDAPRARLGVAAVPLGRVHVVGHPVGHVRRAVPEDSTPADAERSTLGRVARARSCGSRRRRCDRLAQPAHAVPHATHARSRRSPAQASGLAAVLVPTLTRDTVGSGAVLVGGADPTGRAVHVGQQLRVGRAARSRTSCSPAPSSDRPGAGKARSIAIVASPLAVIGPRAGGRRSRASGATSWPGSASVSGRCSAGTGAAIVQSALVPIAVPDSDNPFASGESGKGMLAALLLCVVLGALALATLPGGAGADLGDRHAAAPRWSPSTALLTVPSGGSSCRSGSGSPRARLGGHEPEFVIAVTPVTLSDRDARASYGNARWDVIRSSSCIVVVAVVAGRCGRRSRKAGARRRRAERRTRQPGHRPDADDRPRRWRSIRSTDRSGRNMREKIEGGTAIDDLRVPDDTGPILRRALDNVEHAKPDDAGERSARPPTRGAAGRLARRWSHRRMQEPVTTHGSSRGRDDERRREGRARRGTVDRGDLDRRHVRRVLIAAP